VGTVIGEQDNINPAMLINTNIDFGSFELNFNASDSLSAFVSQLETEGASKESRSQPDSPQVKRSNKGKKRKHSLTPEPRIVTLLSDKWQEEKEERRLDHELTKQAMESMDKRADRMIDVFEKTLQQLACN
jgi:hypothetical protein